MRKVSNILTNQGTFVVLIAAFLIVLPLLYGISTGVLIVLLAASLASIWFHTLRFQKNLILPIVLYAFMVLSIFWSSNIENALRGLERQLALLLIPLAFILMPSITEENRNKILYWFAIGMSVFALFFMGLASLKFIETESYTAFFYHELVAPLDLNAIYISVFVSLCLIFLLFKQPKTRLSMLLLAVLTVFLLLLASKIIIVATALIGVFGIIRTFKKATTIKLMTAFLVGLALLLATPNPIKKRFVRELTVSNVKEVFENDRFNKVYDWTGTTLRLFQARIFSEMVREDNIFFTGYGINNSQSKIVAKQKEYNLWQGYYTYNFHNQYLQAFAELGVFGLLFLFLLLGALLRQYIAGKDILFLSLFFIMFVVFITESYLWRQRGLYHFLVLYCLLFKSIPSGNEPITNKS